MFDFNFDFWMKYALVQTVVLSFTNYIGWSSIPWILLKIPGYALCLILAWVLIVSTIIVIKNYKQ